MRQVIVCVLAMVMLGSWAMAQDEPVEPVAQEEEGERWLISVGVNEYRDWDIPGRAFGEFYAYAVGTPMVNLDLGDVPLEHAAMLGGNLATGANIRDAFGYIAGAGENDTVFIYLCLTPALIQADDGTPQIVFCTHETKIDNIAATSISLDELVQLLGSSPAGEKLLFLDLSLWDVFRPEGVPEDLVPAEDCFAPLAEVCTYVLAASPGETLQEQDLMRPLLGFCLSNAVTGVPMVGENGDEKIDMAELWGFIKSTADSVYSGAEERQTPKAGGLAVEDVFFSAIPSAAEGCRTGMALVGDSLCVDIYEAPNVVGAAPKVSANLFSFTAWCNQQGKRQCEPDEWELACRGSHSHRFGYGDLPIQGNCNIGLGDMATARAERIGSRPLCVNGYGLYDMLGNVAEYTGHGNETSQVRGASYRDRNVGTKDCGSIGDRHPVTNTEFVGMRCCADPT